MLTAAEKARLETTFRAVAYQRREQRRLQARATSGTILATDVAHAEAVAQTALIVELLTAEYERLMAAMAGDRRGATCKACPDLPC